MPAPVGNQFWKLRSTHGRDMIFSSPTVLWEACVEYFEATDARKWVKEDWVGRDAVPVERKTDTPYTIYTLCTFLDITVQTWYEYSKKEGFSEVCTRVSQIMTGQKLEGAIVGAFNHAIVARLEKLAEPTEISGTINVNAVDVTAEDARRIKESLEKGI